MAPPEESPGPVTVWWARPRDPDAHPRLVALLDDHERTRMAAFRRPDDRHRYLAAHALARLVLAAHLDEDPARIALDRTCRCGAQHGKPTLAASPEAPGFSLTHSGGLVGVALGPGAVGLDVEQHRTVEVDGMADHVLSAAERAEHTLDRDTFLVTWTRKEALLKVTADGLSSPMTGITLGPPDAEAVVREWTGDRAPRRPVWVRDLTSPLADHPAAVAGFGPSAPEVRTRDGDAVSPGEPETVGGRGQNGGVSARWVLHLDMDAFFASVEQLTRPTLADRPVLVGGLGPRGVVAGASYQARVFGARSAMPMGQARRRCPHATVLPPRFALYQAISREMMEELAAAGGVLEPVSVDEAFLEPPDLVGASASDVAEFCADLRRRVRARVGLPASVGAGSGKQLAKIASELAKPDGLRVVDAAEQESVLAPLPVRSLWGIGPVSEEALRKVGITTIGQLAATDTREVVGVLGSAVGSELHRLSRGIDERAVAPRGAAKQISAETTFDTDLTAMSAVHEAVEKITVAVHRRLVADGRAARTVTVKARTADFTTLTRSETTAFATRELPTLSAMARRLAGTAVGEGGIRLLGVSVSGFSENPPLALFDAVPSDEGWTTRPLSSPDVPDAAAPGADASSITDAPGPDAPGATVTVDGAEVTVTDDAAPGAGPEAGIGAGPTRPDFRSDDPDRPWRAGDDAEHAEHGHGWVQGSGHGRVTVRFETATTGPGPARTFAAADPALSRADPLLSWRPAG